MFVSGCLSPIQKACLCLYLEVFLYLFPMIVLRSQPLHYMSWPLIQSASLNVFTSEWKTFTFKVYMYLFDVYVSMCLCVHVVFVSADQTF